MRKQRSEAKQPLKVPITRVTVRADPRKIQWMPIVEADLRSSLRVQAFETTVGEPREIVVVGYERRLPSSRERPEVTAEMRRRIDSPLDPSDYRDIVRRALAEDVGAGDITTDATVRSDQRARGVFVVKADCVLAGLDVALEAFRQLDRGIQVTLRRQDGERCRAGEDIGGLDGPARALLIGERTALNFLQRLSGIATRTRQFVDAAAGRIIVLDTRKTTPTLRALEKYAVRAGGGDQSPHRALRRGSDQRQPCPAGRRRPGRHRSRARASAPVPIEVEAQDMNQLDEALAAGAESVLVDNMSIDDIREAVARARGRAKVEISGGVTLDRIPELAATGADYVSAGALTHSAPAVDISFEIEPL